MKMRDIITLKIQRSRNESLGKSRDRSRRAIITLEIYQSKKDSCGRRKRARRTLQIQE